MKTKLFIALFLIVFLSGCQVNTKEDFSSEVIYKSDFINVKTVEILEEPQISEIMWAEIDFDDAFIENDVIFQGVVEKLYEVSIGSTEGGTHTLVYKTILEVRVDNVIKDVNNTIGGKAVVKVVTGASSRRYEQEVASLVEGQEYLLLAKSSTNIKKDNLGLAEYSDVYISSPIEFIIPVIGGNMYEVRGFYSDFCNENCKKVRMYDIVTKAADYEEINDKIVNGESIERYTDDIEVLDESVPINVVLSDVSNKVYSSSGELEIDLSGLYLVDENFVNLIKEYIDK